MRHFAVLLLLGLIAGTSFGMEPASKETVQWWPSAEVDEDTQRVLDAIEKSGASGQLDLDLAKNDNYAGTSTDVEPFGGVQPFKKNFLLQMEYTGPGRAKPEPEHVDTVKLGFIGPIKPTVSVATGGASHEEYLGESMLQGAQLAIEAANEHGGYLKRSIPFELVVKNDNGLWGASGNEIVDFAYKDHVWGIIGTIDGANTHIAIRVALKAEIPMINSGDTDPTLIETNIPWIIRCISDDRQQSYILIDYLYRKLDVKRIAVIRASNRYGRFGVREIRDGSRRLGRPIALEMAYKVGSKDFSLQLNRIKQAKIDAVVHWGDSADGARILNQMREMGMEHPFYACDRCVSDKFVELAGENAEGVICTYPWDPTRDDPKYLAFCEAYRARFGEEPDTYAAHGFDGMSMLIWATQVAGLNRARIRDVIAYRRKPFHGVTGDIPLSAALDDMGEVFLVKRENDRWNYYSRADLDIPRGHIPARDRVSRDLTEAGN